MIVGCDEAGCGALMGDLVAAAVSIPDDVADRPFRDSKVLTERRRGQLAARVREECLWGIGSVSAREIDEIGMGEARRVVFERALDDFASRNPSCVILHVVVDGNLFRPWRDVPYTLEPRADSRYDHVSAASILAKTERDARVCALTGFDAYGWQRNKGYPSKAHRDAIRTHGVTEHHRRSFRLLPD